MRFRARCPGFMQPDPAAGRSAPAGIPVGRGGNTIFFLGAYKGPRLARTMNNFVSLSHPRAPGWTMQDLPRRRLGKPRREADL